MIFFAGILIVPVVVVLIAFLLSKQICWKEIAIILGVQVVVAATSAGICYSSNTSDVETLNGFVTDKKKVWTSCEHSYSCRCRQVCSGSGKNRSCHQKCDTCYDHSNDWNWTVSSTVGDLTISRVDRRGTDEPPRWTAVRMGEPVSVQHEYKNYVKAAPDSLFRHQGLIEKFSSKLPDYPSDIYDYYRLDRLIVVNGGVTDYQHWNEDLSELNSALGSKKQVNIIVVIAKGLPHDYYYALQQKWIGGKKNDVILVVGTDHQRQPRWAEVMTWTTSDIFKIKLRDAVMDMKTLDREQTIRALNTTIMSHHQRKPMAEFEYLMSSITPSGVQWAITLTIGLIISVLMSVYFHNNETFPEYKRRRSWSTFSGGPG